MSEVRKMIYLRKEKPFKIFLMLSLPQILYIVVLHDEKRSLVPGLRPNCDKLFPDFVWNSIF